MIHKNKTFKMLVHNETKLINITNNKKLDSMFFKPLTVIHIKLTNKDFMQNRFLHCKVVFKNLSLTINRIKNSLIN